jgi:hypothetical protein
MVSRRTALRMGAFAALVPVAACTSEPPPPPPPDPLADLAAQARADAALATEVATAAPGLAAAATEIAAARTAHAEALQAEVDRARPPASSTKPKPPATPPTPADPGAALVDALTSAEQKAAELVPSVPRHRAGLLGSVAAGCASLKVVLS